MQADLPVSSQTKKKSKTEWNRAAGRASGGNTDSQSSSRSTGNAFAVFPLLMQQQSVRRPAGASYPFLFLSSPPTRPPLPLPVTYWAIPRWGCAALGFHHPTCGLLGRTRSSRVGCVLARCKQETVAAAKRRERANLKSQRKKKRQEKKRSSNCTSKSDRRQSVWTVTVTHKCTFLHSSVTKAASPLIWSTTSPPWLHLSVFSWQV